MNISVKDQPVAGGPNCRGWFREHLAGQGRSLSDAFENAEHCAGGGSGFHHSGRGLFGLRVELSQDEGDGFFGLIRIRDEMLVTTGEYSYRDERIEIAAGDDLIQFCFNLSGDMSLQLPDSRLIQLRHPVFLVYRHPRGVILPHRTPPGVRERIVSLNLSADSVVRLLGSPLKVPVRLRPMINPSGPSEVPALLLPMTADMFDLSRRLLGNPIRSELGLVEIEAMATHLLCVALNSMTKPRSDHAGLGQERFPTAVWKARDVLSNNLQVLPTIQSVARQAGVCETVLKRTFKQTFGETMGGYATRIRMEHAMALLQQRESSISRIARAIGYRHQPSFAIAFRRHFGLSPRSVRRSCAQVPDGHAS